MRRGEQRLCVQNSLSVFVFWILAALPAPAGAQAQALLGEINGNVVDATQAAIVGARVVATNPDTNFSRQTTTNSVGGYTLVDLPPGRYTIVVTAPGFQTYSQTGATVAPNAVFRVCVILTVGLVNETVAVVASAAALRTDRADIRASFREGKATGSRRPDCRDFRRLAVEQRGERLHGIAV